MIAVGKRGMDLSKIYPTVIIDLYCDMCYTDYSETQFTKTSSRRNSYVEKIRSAYQ